MAVPKAGWGLPTAERSAGKKELPPEGVSKIEKVAQMDENSYKSNQIFQDRMLKIHLFDLNRFVGFLRESALQVF